MDVGKGDVQTEEEQKWWAERETRLLQQIRDAESDNLSEKQANEELQRELQVSRATLKGCERDSSKFSKENETLRGELASLRSDYDFLKKEHETVLMEIKNLREAAERHRTTEKGKREKNEEKNEENPALASCRAEMELLKKQLQEEKSKNTILQDKNKELECSVKEKVASFEREKGELNDHLSQLQTQQKSQMPKTPTTTLADELHLTPSRAYFCKEPASHPPPRSVSLNLSPRPVSLNLSPRPLTPNSSSIPSLSPSLLKRDNSWEIKENSTSPRFCEQYYQMRERYFLLMCIFVKEQLLHSGQTGKHISVISGQLIEEGLSLPEEEQQWLQFIRKQLDSVPISPVNSPLPSRTEKKEEESEGPVSHYESFPVQSEEERDDSFSEPFSSPQAQTIGEYLNAFVSGWTQKLVSF